MFVLAACANGTWTPDPERVRADIKIACHVWDIAKNAAVVAGLFVPGVTSAAVVIDGFVDPVCDGSAVSALTDPATVAWIMDNAERLRALARKPAA